MNSRSAVVLAFLSTGILICAVLEGFEQRQAREKQHTLERCVLNIQNQARQHYQRTEKLGGGGHTYKGFSLANYGFRSTASLDEYRDEFGFFTTTLVGDTVLQVIAKVGDNYRYKGEPVKVKAMIRPHQKQPEFIEKTFPD